ncbi:STAS domain-containing protein, partial [Durusdinium trenchii]
AEAQRYREDNKALQADVVVAKQRIDEIAAQANGKIDSANERIRTLRKERDAAQKEADRLRGAGERLVSRQEECRRERQELAEQKEALLRIVEDLHQTCKAAGMTNAGRHSIKDIGDLTASYRLA